MNRNACCSRTNGALSGSTLRAPQSKRFGTIRSRLGAAPGLPLSATLGRLIRRHLRPDRRSTSSRYAGAHVHQMLSEHLPDDSRVTTREARASRRIFTGNSTKSGRRGPITVRRKDSNWGYRWGYFFGLGGIDAKKPAVNQSARASVWIPPPLPFTSFPSFGFRACAFFGDNRSSGAKLYDCLESSGVRRGITVCDYFPDISLFTRNVIAAPTLPDCQVKPGRACCC